MRVFKTGVFYCCCGCCFYCCFYCFWGGGSFVWGLFFFLLCFVFFVVFFCLFFFVVVVVVFLFFFLWYEVHVSFSIFISLLWPWNRRHLKWVSKKLPGAKSCELSGWGTTIELRFSKHSRIGEMCEQVHCQKQTRILHIRLLLYVWPTSRFSVYLYVR